MTVWEIFAKVVATFTAWWGRKRRPRGALPTAHWRHRDLHSATPFILRPRNAIRTCRSLTADTVTLNFAMAKSATAWWPLMLSDQYWAPRSDHDHKTRSIRPWWNYHANSNLYTTHLIRRIIFIKPQRTHPKNYVA